MNFPESHFEIQGDVTYGKDGEMIVTTAILVNTEDIKIIMSEPKYCINCKWMRGYNWYAKCMRPQPQKLNIVMGKLEDTYLFCDTQREFEGDKYCGKEAKFFTQRKFTLWEKIKKLL